VNKSARDKHSSLLRKDERKEFHNVGSCVGSVGTVGSVGSCVGFSGGVSVSPVTHSGGNSVEVSSTGYPVVSSGTGSVGSGVDSTGGRSKLLGTGPERMNRMKIVEAFGAATLSMMTLNIMTLNIITLNIMTHNDTKHNDT
jgi:hypothetical protein